MKKDNFTQLGLLLLLFMGWSIVGFSQTIINENFNAATTLPLGWTTSRFFGTATQSCAGNSFRSNLYSGATTGNLRAPVFNSNGGAVTVAYDYKVVNWSAATVATPATFGAVIAEYSIDGGTTYSPVTDGTRDASNHVVATTCATVNGTIAAGVLPACTPVLIRIRGQWAAGDYYLYLDNVVITQSELATVPTACSPITQSPLDLATDVVKNPILTWSFANNATSYQVNFGTSPTPPVAGTTTGLSFTPTAPLLANTTYYWFITPINATGSGTPYPTISFTTGTSLLYCSPVYTSSIEPITSVVFNTINNTSPATIGNGGSLTDFTSISTTVQAGQSYPISVQGNTAGDFTTYVRVFIDFNQDGDFDDAGESFDVGPIDNSTGTDGVTATAPIAIPPTNGTSVLPGTTTMRVTKLYFDYQASGCSGGSYGQSEDYTLDILPTFCTAPTVTAPVIVPDCGSNQYSYTVDITGMGTDATLVNNASLTITGANATPTTVTAAPTTITVGPFASGTASNGITVVSPDPLCNVVIAAPATYICPPVNDLCAAATALTPAVYPTVTPGTTFGATNTGDPSAAAACPSTSNNTVWYTFTAVGPPTDYFIKVVGAGGLDAVITLYSGTCDALSAISCADNTGSNATESLLGQNLPAGTYYVGVSGWNDTNGTFNISVRECTETYVDPGGPDANYSANENVVTTFCPTTPGNVVVVNFETFSTEARFDGIYVFNGNSVSAPAILSTNGAGSTAGPLTTPGAFWGSTLPSTFVSTSADGCLTFQFLSDGSVEQAGFTACVSEVAIPRLTYGDSNPATTAAPTIADPCVCKSNATLDDLDLADGNSADGQFDEEIVITGGTAPWTLIAVSGLFETSSAAPPAAPTPIPVGTVLTETAPGVYTLMGIHVDGIGYTATFRDANGMTLVSGNTCSYPNSAFAPALDDEYCNNSAPVLLGGTPNTLGAIKIITIDGLNDATLTPSALTPEEHTIFYSFTAPVSLPTSPRTCKQDIQKTITVGTSAALACKPQGVQVSLDPLTCNATITPNMLMAGNANCEVSYTVTLGPTNAPFATPTVNASHINQTINAMVTETTTGNTCWTSILVEDKTAPALDCPDDVVVPCNFNISPLTADVVVAPLTIASATGFPYEIVDNTPAGTNITIPVNLPAGNTITDVNVLLRVTGNVWLNNLVFTVTSPSGQTVTLWDQLSNCTGDIWVTFDDEGATALACANLTTGVNAAIPFLAGDDLSSFDGSSATGNWVINVADVDAFGDVSSVIEASLIISAEGIDAPGFPNNLTPGQLTQVNANTWTVPAGLLDACTSSTLSFTDATVNAPCPTGNQKVTTRTWKATDAGGRTSTCTQVIEREILELSDITLPPSYDGIVNPTIPCAVAPAYAYQLTPAAVTASGRIGSPTAFGSSDACNIAWTYSDDTIRVCAGTYKVRREWKIIDWCTGGEIIHVQLLKVEDAVGPVLSGTHPNVDISVAPDQCCVNYQIPALTSTDGCSGTASTWATITVRNEFDQVIETLNVTGSAAGVFGLSPCLPIGCHTLSYYAEDNCGNISAPRSFNICVRDLVPPTAVCIQNTVVGLGASQTPDSQVGCANSNGSNYTWVKATSFDNGSYDNCSNILFKVRRMQGNIPAACLSQSDYLCNAFGACNPAVPEFRDSVAFSCCEIGETHTVIFRVYQLNADGSIATYPGTGDQIFNDCMVQVVLQDKLKPVCLPPANVSVNCTAFDPSLWAYGSATAYDNCNLDEITVSVTPAASVYQNTCFNGTITRTWTAYDCNSPRLSSQCTQTITVANTPAYTINFPVDVTTTNCEPGSMPRPTITGDVCAQIGIDSSDEIFTVVPDACYKIVRTWKVINWCRYNPDTPCELVANNPSGRTVQTITNAAGMFRDNTGAALTLDNQFVAGGPVTLGASEGNACYIYKQVIKVTDTGAPTVADETDAEFCDITGNNCTGAVILKALATDACAKSDVRFTHYMIDLNHTDDGISADFDADMTANISESQTAAVGTDSRRATISLELAYGTHKIKWFVTDRCGNIAFIEDVFTVRDCKAPTVFCTPHSTNMMAGGMTQPFWASDFFEYANDNCTPESYLNANVRLRIINQAGTIVVGGASGYPTPAPVGGYQLSLANGGVGVYTVHVYTRDEAGNADYCTTTLVVTDNTVAPNRTVVGKVENASAQGLQDANITISGTSNVTGPFIVSEITDVQGVYEFLNSVPTAQDVIITPTKQLPVATTQGISAYDIVLIQKHILGITPLETPYKMLAADVNNTNSITGSDITDIRKFVLGITSSLPTPKQYDFVPVNYVFANANNPWATANGAIPHTINIPVLASNMMNENFHSFKMGDVSGDALFNSNQVEDRNDGTVYFDATNRMVKAGEEFTVDFNTADALAAYQFTMNLKGLEVLEVIPGNNLTSENFAVFSSRNAVTAVAGTDAGTFSIKFRATQDGALNNMLSSSSTITEAIAYDKAGSRSNVQFRFSGLASGFELFQNSPNPFAETTVIGFNLPEATSATLRIFDELGREVYMNAADYKKGYNTITLTRSQVSAVGMLFYSLETATDKATMQMVRTK